MIEIFFRHSRLPLKYFATKYFSFAA